MPVSVMRLTNINKGIIKLLPQIVTLIILITAIPQLAKLTWRVVFPVSPEDISALPLTMPPPADPELKNVRPAFTLFGLAVKISPTPTDAASLNQVPVSSLKLRLAGLLASSNPARSIAIIEKGNQQVSLSTGDPLPGYDARIAAILPDRIIVNYQGRKEAILLFNDSRAPPPPPPPPGNPAPREATPRTAAKYPHLFIYFAGTQRRQTAGLSAEPRQRRLAVSPVRPAGK